MSNGLPGLDRVIADAVYERLVRSGRKGMGASRLAGDLAGRWEEGEVVRALDRLQREGLAAAVEGRWIAVRASGWVVGTVQPLERGDALIRSGEGGEVGYFVRRRRLGGALAGDLVLLRPLGRRRREARHRLPEAAVVKILDRPLRRLVGTLEIDDDDRRWLVPFDPKLDLEVEVEGGGDLLEDSYVVVEVEALETPRGGHPRGRVVEVLGDLEVPGVDVLVMLRHYRIPERFPEEVQRAAAAFPGDPDPQDWQGREDLRQETVVTIDGESARDFDDAISVRRTAEGSFLLGVHIADVSHYVEEGSPLDLEAYRRGTSVYYPERAIPMLPEALSNGLCSLRPDVPRLSVSVFLDILPDGEVGRRRFAETVIRSRRRLTYEEVRRLLEEPRPDDLATYGEVLSMLQQAERLMRVLNRRRNERGSIDFDLPEGDVVLDTDGTMVGVRPGERTVAHRMIEEFMINANEAVASELSGHDCPALFRIHDPPERTDLEELRAVLRNLGIRLKGDLENLHPSSLQAVLGRVEGRPEEPFVSTLVLRSMRRAAHSPESRGHYALSSRHYTHFTSPIRRYPDLLVHRRLKALLHGRDRQEAEATLLAERLAAIAEHASATERRAEASERDLLQWKKVRFLAHRVGERFQGHITGVQPFGLFVQLDDYYVDGLVPIRSLADDFYRFEASSHRLVGDERERTFQLGDEIEVELVGVDERRRGLDLRIVGMPEPPPRRGKRR